jgi:photosynthetic reaction center cytochrome c subunit
MKTRSLMMVAALTGAALISGCWERPPILTDQRGPRGTAMVELNNPRMVPAQLAANVAPPSTAPLPAEAQQGPKAGEIYKNVQVLGNLSVGEFTRTMVALTEWVSPKEGCNYCHKPGEGLELDTLYTKVVARKMLSMTQAINADNKSHVGETGVTCYTCHRGQHIPANVWFAEAPAKTAKRMMGGDGLQNTPAAGVGLMSLPIDGLSPYLSGATEIRVNGTTALPMRGDKRNTHTIKQAEWTYSLMVHMSEGLGVNCTYCHNTQNFGSWESSTPQRVTAWHGIRMARNLNNAYMEPLTAAFPKERKGPTGDVAKVNCATCHQGVNKPLLGAKMAKDYPALLTKYTPPPPPAAEPTADAKAAAKAAEKKKS